MNGQRLDDQVTVSEALDTLWPGRFRPECLAESTALGEGGLGLDSIEIVELVLECEERAGLSEIRVEDLLEEGSITIGRLTDHLDAR